MHSFAFLCNMGEKTSGQESERVLVCRHPLLVLETVCWGLGHACCRPEVERSTLLVMGSHGPRGAGRV